MIVQALFVGFFLAHRPQIGARLRTLLKLVAFYATQFTLALLIDGDLKSSFHHLRGGAQAPIAAGLLPGAAEQKAAQRRRHLSQSKDRPGRDPLKHFEDKIAERDYLIVVFPFVSAREFPVLMSSLQRRYSLAFSQLGRGGHGELVFRSRPEASGGEPGQGSVGPPDR